MTNGIILNGRSYNDQLENKLLIAECKLTRISRNTNEYRENLK